MAKHIWLGKESYSHFEMSSRRRQDALLEDEKNGDPAYISLTDECTKLRPVWISLLNKDASNMESLTSHNSVRISILVLVY